MVGSSCKRHDLLREKQVEKLQEILNDNEIENGRGLNQQLAPIRVDDTC